MAVTTDQHAIWGDAPDWKHFARRQFIRAFVSTVPRAWRRRLLPHYWPVSVRQYIGRAEEHEIADYERAKIESRDRRQMKGRLLKLQKQYKRLIINALARAGASYKWREDGERYIRKIKFREIRISVDGGAIYFRVETRSLPDKILIAFLRDDDVVETVCAACDRHVEVRWDFMQPEKGFWYVVQLKLGNRGIPREVDFSKILEAIESRPSSRALTIGVGAAENGRAVFADIDDMPHVLVAGATGTGKSVWMKQVLVTLALRNTPDKLKFVMIDLKGGVELSQFENMPHVLEFVNHKDRVVSTLKKVMTEVERRQRIFKNIGVVNIAGYNKRRYHSNRPLPKLPYWIVVVDELANLMLDKEIRKDAEPLLADITALARAAGIHCILATQRPSTDVIIGLIKANVPTRLAFATASHIDSRVIIDSSHAYGLAPSGRMIYMSGKYKTEIQGPLITPSMVSDKLKGIASGERVETLKWSQRHDFTPEDFFIHALNRYKGEYSLYQIWNDFRPMGVSRPEVTRAANEFADKEFELDGKLYRLTEPNQDGKSVARRLVEVIHNEVAEELADDVQGEGDTNAAPIEIQAADSTQSTTFRDETEAGETETEPTDEEQEEIYLVGETPEKTTEYDEWSARIKAQFGPG